MRQHSTRIHQVARTLKASAETKRTRAEKFSDRLMASFGSVTFFLLNGVCFLGWILVNVNVIPGLSPFDPFPFGLLTMIVSLEAILLSIFVLISQNRAAKIDELRDEIDLQIDVMAEQELTKMLQLQSKMLKKMGVDVSDDAELKRMLEPSDPEEIKKEIERQE